MKAIEVSNPETSEQAIQNGQTEDTVVLRNGQPVAMVVPFDQDDLQWYATEHDPQFIQSIAIGREQIKAGKSISHEALKKQLGID